MAHIRQLNYTTTMTRFDKLDLDQLTRDFERSVRVTRLRRKYQLCNQGLLEALVEANRRGLMKTSSFARLLVKKVVYPFPKDSEIRFKKTLSSLSTELKQVLLLELERSPRTYIEIGKRLLEDSNTRLPSPENLASNLVDTLVPGGFATEERLGRGFGLVRRYFGLSKAGEEYGQPLAAFTLRYAVDHNISLYQLLGQANSSKASCSPYNRTRIVELVSQNTSRMIDLMDALGLSIEDVRQHLDKLEKLGILRYETLDYSRKGARVYTWNPGRSPIDARMVGELKSLTQEVVAWFQRHGKGKRRQIARAITHRNPSNISHVLAGLIEQGLVLTPFASFDKSRISLSSGASLVLDYARSIRNALADGPELENMREMLEELYGNRKMLCKYLDAGIELYRRISPGLNARSRGDREAEMLEFIKEYESAKGSGPRPVDLAKGLGWTHGIVTLYLRGLIRKSLLSKKRTGPATTYHVA